MAIYELPVKNMTPQFDSATSFSSIRAWSTVSSFVNGWCAAV